MQVVVRTRLLTLGLPTSDRSRCVPRTFSLGKLLRHFTVIVRLDAMEWPLQADGTRGTISFFFILNLVELVFGQILLGIDVKARSFS